MFINKEYKTFCAYVRHQHNKCVHENSTDPLYTNKLNQNLSLMSVKGYHPGFDKIRKQGHCRSHIDLIASFYIVSPISSCGTQTSQKQLVG